MSVLDLFMEADKGLFNNYVHCCEMSLIIHVQLSSVNIIRRLIDM